MRLIFMGTPEFSVLTLNALIEAGHEICAVYTQPPRRAGRGKQLQPSPVHRRADELGIIVRHPESMKGEAEQAQFAALGADAAVVVAYGLILPCAVLDAPRLGCFNVHASLLPRWRGAAPIQRAILAGDAQTGVTIMRMAQGLDTGPMLAKAAVPVEDKNARELHDQLAELGAALMVDALARLANIAPEPQDERAANYAAKIDKAETRLDFTRSAAEVERQVRGFYPMAWFDLAGERVRVLKAEALPPSAAVPGEVVPGTRLVVGTGGGDILLASVQPAGKSAMASDAFLRGRPIAAGTRL